jgi:hypothetical protein
VRPRSLRRRRFGFGFTLPGTQVAADTTDLEVLGVPLELLAAPANAAWVDECQRARRAS